MQKCREKETGERNQGSWSKEFCTEVLSHLDFLCYKTQEDTAWKLLQILHLFPWAMALTSAEICFSQESGELCLPRWLTRAGTDPALGSPCLWGACSEGEEVPRWETASRSAATHSSPRGFHPTQIVPLSCSLRKAHAPIPIYGFHSIFSLLQSKFG